MKSSLWIIVGAVGAGMVAVSIGVVIFSGERQRGEYTASSAPSPLSDQGGSVWSPGPARDRAETIGLTEEWMQSQERSLSPLARDVISSATTLEYRTMLIVNFAYREEPVYEPRVLWPFLEGATEDAGTIDGMNRNSLASGFLARTWLLAGPNADWAERFAQVAITTAPTDDVATQSASLVLLEELVGSGLISMTPKIESTMDTIRSDALNIMFADKFRDRVLHGDN